MVEGDQVSRATRVGATKCRGRHRKQKEATKSQVSRATPEAKERLSEDRPFFDIRGSCTVVQA